MLPERIRAIAPLEASPPGDRTQGSNREINRQRNFLDIQHCVNAFPKDVPFRRSPTLKSDPSTGPRIPSPQPRDRRRGLAVPLRPLSFSIPRRPLGGGSHGRWSTLNRTLVNCEQTVARCLLIVIMAVGEESRFVVALTVSRLPRQIEKRVIARLRELFDARAPRRSCKSA